MTDQKIIADLGGVGHYKNGTITVNIDPLTKPDIVCDISARAQELGNWFPKRAVHLFTCIHTLEHLEPADAVASLEYWRQFLEPRGRVYIVVPNIEQVWQDIFDGKCDPEIGIAVMFRNSTKNFPVPYAVHKWGWTRKTLARDLNAAGYDPILEPERYFGVPETFTFDVDDYKDLPGYKTYNFPNLRMVGIKRE